MGEYFRSQPMTLIQMVIPADVAHDTVDELGKIGVVQFCDMNPELTAPQRTFVNEVKRLDELDRKLRFFRKHLEKFCTKYALEYYLNGLNEIPEDDQGAREFSLPELEEQFEDVERSISELHQGEEGVRRSVSVTEEKRYVLQVVEGYFEEEEGSSFGSSLKPLICAINRARAPVFERVLWRLTRGNVFIKSSEIPVHLRDPSTDEYLEKNAFLVLTQSESIMEKITKVCESFGANIYDCPQMNEFSNEIDKLRRQENDFNKILKELAKGSERIFEDVSRNYAPWRSFVLKEKAIYHTMNLFSYKIGRKTLVAEGWCPDADLEKVSYGTQQATSRSRSALPVVFKPLPDTKLTPPTYFKTNRFTWIHQEIVDAYGVARYQEINPTVFSMITFPFLFGVMFGDVGHGLLMLLFVTYLILKEDELMKGNLNELLQNCFDGRYVIVLMSLFSIYCGFLYNECFSVPMAPGGFPEASAWNFQNGSLIMKLNDEGYRYPIGVDPAWKGAENELYYYNSLKMKMSVILGVTQMILGICLTGMNARYKEKPYDFWYEFVPQLLFMVSIFGYLCFLILLKWLLQWDQVLENDPNDVGREIPSLLSLLVNMFLSPNSLNGESIQDRIWPSQMYIQMFLLLLALVCVPWMLIPKPYFLKKDHEKKRGYEGLAEESEEREEEEPFEFEEILIHQVIHTIEYVLGAISNTASYLRLWALSLAHSELSTVFWEKVFVTTLAQGDMLSLFVGFGAWAALSFAVLMVMESLSAFLHALRLHWVEFQNKFYAGDGYKFLPFSYDRILLDGLDDE